MDSRPCANCRAIRTADELDQNDWCTACRREVVRRATTVGRVVGVLGALAVAAVLFATVDINPRFLAGWLVLIAGVHLFLYRLVRRVAFEMIRSRGVPPPPEN